MSRSRPGRLTSIHAPSWSKHAPSWSKLSSMRNLRIPTVAIAEVIVFVLLVTGAKADTSTPTEFRFVSESAIFNPATREVLFTVAFNESPDFFTTDAVGRQKHSFQYFIGVNGWPPFPYPPTRHPEAGVRSAVPFRIESMGQYSPSQFRSTSLAIRAMVASCTWFSHTSTALLQTPRTATLLLLRQPPSPKRAEDITVTVLLLRCRPRFYHRLVFRLIQSTSSSI